jgi:hypothetical protein
MLFGRGPRDTMGVRDYRRLCTGWNISVSVVLVGYGVCPCSHVWPVTSTCGRCGAQGVDSARGTVLY